MKLTLFVIGTRISFAPYDLRACPMQAVVEVGDLGRLGGGPMTDRAGAARSAAPGPGSGNAGGTCGRAENVGGGGGGTSLGRSLCAACGAALDLSIKQKRITASA